MKTIITNGRIVDPANNLDLHGSLLLEKGKIAAIWPAASEPGADTEIIDAAGAVVCPGFVDLHIHEDPYDPQTDELDQSIARSLLLMGVTTAIGGNCGINVYDPARYLELLDERGACINVGLLAGHTYLRDRCGGTDKYAAVSAETMVAMKQLGAQQLAAGCFGISFGVKYVPGANAWELMQMASLCDPKRHLVASHIRQDVGGVFDAALEMAQLSLKTEIPVQISHLGSMGGYGQMEKLLALLEQWREEGIDLRWDCYPYDAFSTTIGATTYDDGFLADYQAGYDSILICDGQYAGQRCTEEIFRELRQVAPETTTVGYFMKQEDVEMALRHPLTIVASDGLRNGDQGHPRAAGTFPRFLDQYIKSGKISLLEGLAKLTSEPARRLGLTQKGHFGIGADADVTIFSLADIKDKATYEKPALPPEGIRQVLIGGQTALKDGVIVKDSLGRSVRK